MLQTRTKSTMISFRFNFSSRWHRSVRKGPYVLRPTSSSLPKVALETVPIFAWLNTDRSRPWRVEWRPLPFSTPLYFRRSMLWCSGQSMFRKFLKPLSTSALPSCRPDMISAVLARLSAETSENRNALLQCYYMMIKVVFTDIKLKKKAVLAIYYYKHQVWKTPD